MFHHRRRWLAGSLMVLLALALLSTFVPPLTAAQPPTARHLIPIGAGYEEAPRTLFVEQAIAYNSDDVVTIRLLPTPYVTDPYSITAKERALNLSDAQVRADQIAATCATLVVSPTTCLVTVPDIQTRSDALEPSSAEQLGPDVDGMYMVGGDQTFAMLALGNTPVEQAMAARYASGVPFAGNSAGAAVQSRYMIAGYTDLSSYGEVGLHLGAVDLWYGPTSTVTRGLSFGLDNAVIEQHVLERGRLPRLLQATQQLPADVNKLGIGVDWGTGIVIENQQVISTTAGNYAALVVDEQSYGAAATASYTGTMNTLAIRNVALHVLPPGPYGYDMTTLKPIVNSVADTSTPDISGRSFGMLTAPAGAAPLLLGGDLWSNEDTQVSQRFADLASGNGPTLVLAAGFASDTEAQTAADDWAGYLNTLGVTSTTTAIITPATDLEPISTTLGMAGAVLFTSDNQALLAAEVGRMRSAGLDQRIKQLWASGTPMLFDNAAAAAAGAWMTAMPTPLKGFEIEAEDTFISGTVTISPGLSLIDSAVFEPRAMYDYRYGRMVSHAEAHPDAVVFGIERNTAIEITPAGATVRGEEAVIALDARYARVLTAGSNEAFAATWLLLDTFTTNQPIVTSPAAPAYRAYLPVLLR